ncbi:MAG: hypothetical protein WBD25_18215 [Terriglobales bacterium]
MKVSANRGVFVRALCVLCIALVCVIGSIQATHSHLDDSTTSHHTCSICATAHAGINTQTAASAPVLVATVLSSPVAEVSAIFRPAITQFIRPPPAF